MSPASSITGVACACGDTAAQIRHFIPLLISTRFISYANANNNLVFQDISVIFRSLGSICHCHEGFDAAATIEVKDSDTFWTWQMEKTGECCLKKETLNEGNAESKSK